MKPSDILELPEYFDRYITLVEDIELKEAFDKSIEDLQNVDVIPLQKLKNKRYTPEKWTVNEIVQHIADIERLLCAGTLRFARNEENFVISFNEEGMVRNSKANQKSIKKIIEELICIRKSTIALYQSFDNEDLLKTGINWKYRISILAMGFNIIGHQIHHFNVIREQYLPLIK